jgi:hypothetical protein
MLSFLITKEKKTCEWCYHVLSVTKKLLLVGVITNWRCLVIFGQNFCWIIVAKQPCKVLAKGIKDFTNGLYKLLTAKPEFVALKLITITMEVDLWHRFHWHLHFSRSINIVTTKNIKRHAIDSINFCSHMWRLHYGKATSPTCITNFSSSINKENGLIHSDLCGPFPHLLLSGAWYHYKKLCPSKPHHHATKTQKTTHIQ